MSNTNQHKGLSEEELLKQARKKGNKCRCGTCINQKTNKGVAGNYCEDCGMGRCPNCGRGTRGG